MYYSLLGYIFISSKKITDSRAPAEFSYGGGGGASPKKAPHHREKRGKMPPPPSENGPP